VNPSSVTAVPPLNRAAPFAYKALLLLAEEAAEYARSVGLAPTTLELVKIRASQINGCAYCLRMHVREAVALGEVSDRLAVVAAWRDTEYFSAEERAALVIAERTTLIADRASQDEEDLTALTAGQIAAAEWIAITINAFNRLSILSAYPVRGGGAQ
jgi:AhpD family alkylhydroperoxidase